MSRLEPHISLAKNANANSLAKNAKLMWIIKKIITDEKGGRVEGKKKSRRYL